MFRTTTVTELRSELSTLLKELDNGPIVVMSRSRPTAVLIDPDMYDVLIEKSELLEDLLDGRRALAEYIKDPGVALDAEEVFERLGH